MPVIVKEKVDDNLLAEDGKEDFIQGGLTTTTGFYCRGERSGSTPKTIRKSRYLEQQSRIEVREEKLLRGRVIAKLTSQDFC